MLDSEFEAQRELNPAGVAIVQHFLGANADAPRQNPQARNEDSGLHCSNR